MSVSRIIQWDGVESRDGGGGVIDLEEVAAIFYERQPETAVFVFKGNSSAFRFPCPYESFKNASANFRAYLESKAGK